MLGVKCDNRESVHGPMKVALTPNIGLEDTQTRSGGVGEIGRFEVGPNDQRRTTNDDSPRTNFDN
jgi:hypothetical protein